MSSLKPIFVNKKSKSMRRKKPKVFKNIIDDTYDDVRAKIDTYPPKLDKEAKRRIFEQWTSNWKRINDENWDLVLAIKANHYNRGKVDCHWKYEPQPFMVYYYNRVNFLSRINYENKFIHKIIETAEPRVQPTSSLLKDWDRNRRDILDRAQNKFVLFPPVPTEDMEDPVFAKPKGVKRPRIFMTLSHQHSSPMGELQVELFTDVCPQTCKLFLELLMGDGVGYGYVGTSFFRKVPQLFWSGGDVVYDNGHGCYAQKGRTYPIGAENYHFKHTMPGLLSMRMTCDDEMCGIFNITFKPLPQFDNKNVVFGRVIRPSELFNSMRVIGNPLNTQPIILLSAARMRVKRQWRHGVRNSKLVSLTVDKRKVPDVADNY